MLETKRTCDMCKKQVFDEYITLNFIQPCYISTAKYHFEFCNHKCLLNFLNKEQK